MDPTSTPIEEIARARRIEAENHRLKNEIELLEAKLAETSTRLERVQSEASESFQTLEQNRQAFTECLQEARAQSQIAEAALQAKMDEIARLRLLNQSLRQIVSSPQALDEAESIEATKRYVALAASIRSEEALQKAREKWLVDQAPETGMPSALGSDTGAVSGTSLGANAGEEGASGA
jgi:regulator of replication initiation timing